MVGSDGGVPAPMGASCKDHFEDVVFDCAPVVACFEVVGTSPAAEGDSDIVLAVHLFIWRRNVWVATIVKAVGGVEKSCCADVVEQKVEFWEAEASAEEGDADEVVFRSALVFDPFGADGCGLPACRTELE